MRTSSAAPTTTMLGARRQRTASDPSERALPNSHTSQPQTQTHTNTTNWRKEFEGTQKPLSSVPASHPAKIFPLCRPSQIPTSTPQNLNTTTTATSTTTLTHKYSNKATNTYPCSNRQPTPTQTQPNKRTSPTITSNTKSTHQPSTSQNFQKTQHIHTSSQPTCTSTRSPTINDTPSRSSNSPQNQCRL